MRPGLYPTSLLLVSTCLTPALSNSIQRLERRDLSDRDTGSNDALAGLVKPLSTREDMRSSLEDKLESVTIPRDIFDGKGTKDAPVDGQDGRPHAGPFIETNAERDRKKAKEKGEDDLPPAGHKPGPKDGSASFDSDLPATNDGVMDDRNREGPKEGTRGTEGGISEKNEKQRLDSMSGKEVTKTPSEPKEAPPLPHSEQEKLSESKEKEAKLSKGSKASDGKTKQDESEESEISGLKVWCRVPSVPPANL
jgi:hypothetical protein